MLENAPILSFGVENKSGTDLKNKYSMPVIVCLIAKPILIVN